MCLCGMVMSLLLHTCSVFMSSAYDSRQNACRMRVLYDRLLLCCFLATFLDVIVSRAAVSVSNASNCKASVQTHQLCRFPTT